MAREDVGNEPRRQPFNEIRGQRVGWIRTRGRSGYGAVGLLTVVVHASARTLVRNPNSCDSAIISSKMSPYATAM